jgi:probable addiction module antidote protein
MECKMNQTKSIDYQDYLVSSLHNPEEARGYLNAALQGGEMPVFLLALRSVIAAQGGMTKLAQKIHCSRSSLYKTLSQKGNPEFKNIIKILQALDMNLVI